MALDQQASVAQGINKFGSTLFEAVDVDPKSQEACFLSPWGIAHALAMLLEGAAPGSPSHKQLTEIVFSLNLTNDNNDNTILRDSLHGLTTSISKETDTLTVTDANSVWVAPGIHLLPSFSAALSKYFKADTGTLESAAKVNAWVSKATHEKIKTIIDDGIARTASLILVNAIYFKGLWEAPFSKQNTAPLTFHLLDGSYIDVPAMYLHYKEGNAIQGTTLNIKSPHNGKEIPCVAVKMAYKGGDFSAVAAMPNMPLEQGDGTGGGLKLEGGIAYDEALAACRREVMTRLSAGNGLPSAAAAGGDGEIKGAIAWKSVGDPDMHAVKIYLPRFEVEFQASLGDPLQKLGLKSPFYPGDFTQIAEGVNDLMVSDVIHKVYAKVDEQGTEAAAATAVVMVRSAFIRPPPELFVRFDRPFIFSIVHEPSGLALFTGEVYKPEKWKG